MVKISTNRLSMAPILKKDTKDIHTLLSLPETDRYNALGIPATLKETTSYVNIWIDEMKSSPVTNFTLSITRTKDNQFVGLFGIKLGPPKYQMAEIWYKFHSDFWNKGYATESAKSVIDYCFLKLDLHRVEAGASVDNKASLRVFEKLGMQKEGIKKQCLPLKTGWSDAAEYAILRDQFYA